MPSQRISLIVIFVFGGAALLAGCGKKEAQVPVETTVPAAATTATAPAAPANPTPAPVGQDSLNGVQAAIQQKDYDKAAEMLINLQNASRKTMTPAQATAMVNQMRELQGYVMGGVSAGDPKAIAAAQRIRAASMPK